jgi:hypothetical protein
MELYLQFGYGMMEHSKILIEKWGGGTVILSPRDLNENQITRLGLELSEIGGQTLLDPQLYDPRGNHHGLKKHDYWIDNFETSMLLAGPPLQRLLSEIRNLNSTANTEKYILPGIFCERVNDDWYAVEEAIITESLNLMNDKRRLATICLSAEALRFEDQIESLLARSEEWNVDGYYVVAEHPNAEYLVEDPLWLTNLMHLCAGLKLQNKVVISGYSTHQMLCMAATNIDAIASGTYLNVRSFSTEKFSEGGEDDKRKTTWYYCPQALIWVIKQVFSSI